MSHTPQLAKYTTVLGTTDNITTCSTANTLPVCNTGVSGARDVRLDVHRKLLG